MKHKKLLIAVILAVALLAIGVTVAAIMPGSMFDVSVKEDPGKTDKTKTLPEEAAALSGVRQASYKESEYDNGEKIYDIYEDASGNTYRLAVDGKLVGFEAPYVWTSSKEQVSKIGDSEAKKRCEQYAATLLGDSATDYTFQSLQYDEAFRTYHYALVLFCGDGGFIEKDACYVDLTAAGELKSATLGRYAQFIGFDEALLNGITKEQLTEFASGQLRESVGDVEDAEAVWFSLAKTGDKYAVDIRMEYTATGGEKASFQTYYDLKN